MFNWIKKNNQFFRDFDHENDVLYRFVNKWRKKLYTYNILWFYDMILHRQRKNERRKNALAPSGGGGKQGLHVVHWDRAENWKHLNIIIYIHLKYFLINTLFYYFLLNFGDYVTKMSPFFLWFWIFSELFILYGDFFWLTFFQVYKFTTV